MDSTRVQPNLTTGSLDPLLTVTFGDAEMTYVQFIVMQGNNDLLKKVLEKSDGREHFLQSRDQVSPML